MPSVNQPITKQTLIFFDEIQECEDASEYYVVSAGSLLGLMLAKGFPVGKVDFMRLTPMTFEEFLKANRDNNLVEYMKSIDSIKPIPDVFNGPLMEKLKMYYIIGGMPEAVKVWCEERDIREVERVQSEILEAYEHDFGKHAEPTDVPKIRLIWNSLSSQLTREISINIHPHSGWYFIFGHSPNITGGAQVRCLLACQPCILCLLTRKRVPWVEH